MESARALSTPTRLVVLPVSPSSDQNHTIIIVSQTTRWAQTAYRCQVWPFDPILVLVGVQFRLGANWPHRRPFWPVGRFSELCIILFILYYYKLYYTRFTHTQAYVAVVQNTVQ